MILKSADAEDVGVINRDELQQAMIANKEKINLITEESEDI
jgi:hypothetical protein